MLRAGVIGVGYWGPNLVRTLNEIEGVELVKVADLRPGRREFIESRFPKITTTADTSEVISDPAIDAVFIATPPSTHYAFAVAALRAGKHVLVEKPLTTNVSQAEEIVRLAMRAERKLAVGHLFLYHPAVAMLRDLLDRRELGDVYFLSSTRANVGPPNTKVDVVWDLGPHDVSIVLHLMNETPCEVLARGACFTNEEFCETACLTLRFPSGRLAQVNLSWLTPNKTRLLQMICSRKTVVYDDMQMVQKVQVFDSGQDSRVAANDKDAALLSYGPGSIWVPPLRGGEPLRLECEDFMSSILENREPVSSGRRALEVVRVLEAASHSILRTGACTTTAAERK